MKEGTTVLGSTYLDRSTGFKGLATATLESFGVRTMIEITRAADSKRVEDLVPELFLEPVAQDLLGDPNAEIAAAQASGLDGSAIILGSPYRDLLTGFKGTATGRARYLGGRPMIEITRGSDGMRIEEWVPEMFLEPANAIEAALAASPPTETIPPPTETAPPTATLPGGEPVSDATPPNIKPPPAGGAPVTGEPASGRS